MRWLDTLYIVLWTNTLVTGERVRGVFDTITLRDNNVYCYTYGVGTKIGGKSKIRPGIINLNIGKL